MQTDWQQIGPPGGYFKSFTFDDGGRAYAGSDDSGGIWASDDDGRSWRLLTADHPDMCGWDLVWGEDGALYAVDHYGRYAVLRTRDRGATWQRLGAGLMGRQAGQVCAIIAADGHLLIGTGLNPGRPGDGLWRSDDDGATWQPAGWQGYAVPKLAMHRGAIYAAINTAHGADSPGLHRTRDWGRTWEPVLAMPLTSLDAWHDCLIAGAGAALVRSVDEGATWEPFGSPGVTWGVQRRGDDFFTHTIMGGPGVLRRTSDSDWQPAQIETFSIMGLGVNPANSTVLCSAFANAGIYRSGDNGETFEPSNTGLLATYGTAMHAEGDRILVSMLGTYHLVPGADVTALMQSRDGGATWQRAGDIRAHGLCVDRHGDTVLVGTFYQGLWLSTDDAVTFSAVIPEASVSAVAVTPELLHASLHDAASGMNIISSPDGDQWDVTGPGLHALNFAGRFAGGHSGVARLDDGRWSVVDPTPVTCVAADGDTVWTGTAAATVRRSDDAGRTWTTTELPVGHATRGVYRIVADGDEVWAGLSGAEEGPNQDSTGGMFVSRDRGATWESVGDGMVTSHVWGLAVTGTDVLAATYGGGVLRRRR